MARPRKEPPLTPTELALVEANYGLAYSVARTMYGWPRIQQLGTLEDVEQLACIVLMEAARRFRPELGYKFSTYACSRIRHRLGTFAKVSGLIRVPHYVGEAKYAGKYAADGKRAIALLPIGVDLGPAGHEDAIPAIDPADARQISPLERATAGEENEAIGRLLDQLTDREREIIISRFGLVTRKAETLTEIGERIGVTRERVRQIEMGALAKMRSRADMPATPVW